MDDPHIKGTALCLQLTWLRKAQARSIDERSLPSRKTRENHHPRSMTRAKKVPRGEGMKLLFQVQTEQRSYSVHPTPLPKPSFSMTHFQELYTCLKKKWFGQSHFIDYLVLAHLGLEEKVCQMMDFGGLEQAFFHG